MIPFLLQYLICFLIFVFLQAMFINGVKSCFEEGMILYKAKLFFDKHLNEFWRKPIYGCIRCMSSVYGALTFFPTAIYFFGIKWEEVVVYVADVFILVFLNYYLYKRQ